MRTIHPLNDRVILRRESPETLTPGGIHIPDSAREKSLRAVVVAVGPGRVLDSGARLEPRVKPGDVVQVESKYVGTEVDVDGVKHFVVREDDILAVIEG